MERLKMAHEIANKALSTLETILTEPPGIIVRDASIQRFEYTFEAIWKLLKVYLFEYHGIDVASPKACFREVFKNGLLTKEQTDQVLVMTDDRNLTSHTYIQAIADVVYSRVPEYAKLMRIIVDKTV